jgi:hypothetical protein
MPQKIGLQPEPKRNILPERVQCLKPSKTCWQQSDRIHHATQHDPTEAHFGYVQLFVMQLEVAVGSPKRQAQKQKYK